MATFDWSKDPQWALNPAQNGGVTLAETELETLNNTPLISRLLTTQIHGEESEAFALANYANAAAILFENLKAVNWAGFYFYDEKVNELILGPFLGKPAVVRIKPGAGVVGKTFDSQQTTVVGDVHAFSGHIACDPASNAEIVVPITRADGTKLGVLDIDSTAFNRFGGKDVADLEDFVKTLVAFV